MQKRPSEVMESYKCPVCDVVKVQLSKYLQHLQLLHHHQPDFSIVCNIEGCKRSYKTVPSFRTHIYRKHTATLWRPTDDHFQNVTLSEETEEDEVDDAEDSEDSQSVHENSLPDLNTLLSGLQKHVALFILNLQEKHLLPKVKRDYLFTPLHIPYVQDMTPAACQGTWIFL